MGLSLSLARFDRTRDAVLLALHKRFHDQELALSYLVLEAFQREDAAQLGWIASSRLDTVLRALSLNSRWSKLEVDAFAHQFAIEEDGDSDDQAVRTSSRLDYLLFLDVLFFPVPVPGKNHSTLQLTQLAVVDTVRWIVHEGVLADQNVSVRELKLGGTKKPLNNVLDETLNVLRQRINVLRLASHPNLAQYVTSLQADVSLYLVERPHPSCSLQAILASFGPMKETTIRRYAAQLLDGLSYLHIRDVVHASLGLESLHINSSGQLKLSDFGIGAELQRLSDQAKPGNPSVDWTEHFPPPEVRRCGASVDGACTKQADVWATGILLLQMLYGAGKDAEAVVARESPARTKSDKNVVQAATASELTVPAIPAAASKNLRAVIRACLQPKPRMRPSVGQLLEMEFFQFDTTQATTEILRDVCLDLDASIQRLTAPKCARGSQTPRSAARASSTKQSAAAPQAARMLSGR